jgi:hypothetical protein
MPGLKPGPADAPGRTRPHLAAPGRTRPHPPQLVTPAAPAAPALPALPVPPAYGYVYALCSPSGSPSAQNTSRKTVHTTMNVTEYGSIIDATVPMPAPRK